MELDAAFNFVIAFVSSASYDKKEMNRISREQKSIILYYT